MSEENRDFAPMAQAASPAVGSQLKSARESKGMSVGDIAMALKLGARQVEALESGDWERLPGHTFIRGFVRNYARLLQLDPAPLMTQLESVIEVPQQRLNLSSTQATMPKTGQPRRRDFAVALAGLGMAVIAAGIYFALPADLSSLRDNFQALLGVGAAQPENAAANKPAPASPPEPLFPPGTTTQQIIAPQAVDRPAESASTPAPGTETPPSIALVPPPILSSSPSAEPLPATPATPATASAQPASAAPAAAVPAPSADGKAVLHFVVEQESWIEVRDRTGRTVFSQRRPAGSEQNVEGAPPFFVVVGNAPGVKLSLRGQPIDLMSRTRGHVARFTVE